MPEQVFHTIRLLTKKTIARDVIELRFTKPEGFLFAPGQFVQCRIPDGDKQVLRSYSISSTPDKEYLELCVKVLPEGKASAFFDALAIGGEAFVSSAKGMFVIKPEHQSKKYFVATGTGLAPIMSMVEALPHDVTQKNELLFGVRHQADVFWVDRLAQVVKNNPSFTFQLTLSQPDEPFDTLRGRVTEHVFADIAGEYYICGNVEMVKEVRAILLEKGVPAKALHFEIF
jgi:ferredoxin-NADP reductase